MVPAMAGLEGNFSANPLGLITKQAMRSESERQSVSDNDTVGATAEASVAFGANEWLVDELWTLYQQDPGLVEPSWWPLFESRAAQAGTPLSPPASPAAAPADVSPADDPSPVTAPIAKTTSIKPKEAPIPAEAPTSPTAVINLPDTDEAEERTDVVNPLRGMAKALATNMDQSIQVPTATSVRTVPAKLMIDNRIVINNHLRQNQGWKSFLHPPDCLGHDQGPSRTAQPKRLLQRSRRQTGSGSPSQHQSRYRH